MARDARPVGRARVRADAPADPGAAACAARWPAVPRALPARRPRARPRRWATWCGAWAGLGYNRRAVNLHRCADHGGRTPRRDASRTTSTRCWPCPGIGPYTARAVLVFALRARHRPRRHQRRPVRRPRPRRAPAAGEGGAGGRRRRRARRRRLALGAGGVRPRRRPSAPSGRRAATRARCATATAPGRPQGGPSPTRSLGSAGIATPQSRFEGSDRQGRGRLVAALRTGPVGDADLAARDGLARRPGPGRVGRRTLVADGLAVRTRRRVEARVTSGTRTGRRHGKNSSGRATARQPIGRSTRPGWSPTSQRALIRIIFPGRHADDHRPRPRPAVRGLAGRQPLAAVGAGRSASSCRSTSLFARQARLHGRFNLLMPASTRCSPAWWCCSARAPSAGVGVVIAGRQRPHRADLRAAPLADGHHRRDGPAARRLDGRRDRAGGPDPGGHRHQQRGRVVDHRQRRRVGAPGGRPVRGARVQGRRDRVGERARQLRSTRS